MADTLAVYCDYHTPTVFYGRLGDDWYIIPAVTTGWAQRRPWHPEPAYAQRMAQPSNRVTFYGRPSLAKQMLGIPPELGAAPADWMEASGLKSRLDAAGEALFGPRWQSDLAAAMGVSDRTMRRWAADPESIPEGVWADLRALCARRGQALLEISEMLSAPV